jgi:hypothetical protein
MPKTEKTKTAKTAKDIAKSKGYEIGEYCYYGDQQDALNRDNYKDINIYKGTIVDFGYKQDGKLYIKLESEGKITTMPFHRFVFCPISAYEVYGANTSRFYFGETGENHEIQEYDYDSDMNDEDFEYFK